MIKVREGGIFVVPGMHTCINARANIPL